MGRLRPAVGPQGVIREWAAESPTSVKFFVPPEAALHEVPTSGVASATPVTSPWIRTTVPSVSIENVWTSHPGASTTARQVPVEGGDRQHR